MYCKYMSKCLNGDVNMEKEIWKDIKGYEGLYQVSNLGYVKSLKKTKEVINKGKKYIKTIKEKELKGSFHEGYKTVGLIKNGRTITKYIHRLVAEAFIPNPYNYPIINHIDEDKSNNHYKNLEWCTYEYNNNYGNKTKDIKKSIIQYDLDFNFIKRWESISEIENELLISVSNICSCCRFKIKSAGGYIWRYE